MKTQHTPGRWNEQSLGPWIYDDELAAVLTKDMTGTVARLLPPPSEMPGGAVDKELLRAAGTLLAAAPELLNVLQRMTPKFMQYTDEDQGLYLAAKALIKKLTDQ